MRVFVFAVIDGAAGVAEGGGVTEAAKASLILSERCLGVFVFVFVVFVFVVIAGLASAVVVAAWLK